MDDYATGNVDLHAKEMIEIVNVSCPFSWINLPKVSIKGAIWKIVRAINRILCR
jgi:hypothetical protein